jgi:TPR repeat protein
VARLAATTPAISEEQPGQGGSGAGAEIVFWESIRSSNDAADYASYLERWPDGTFAPLAQRRLAALQQQTLPSTPSGEDVGGATPDAGAEEARLQLERLGAEALARTSELPFHLLQYALQALGHLAGPVDAAPGPVTDAAVAAFQASIGVPAGPLTPEEIVQLIGMAAATGQPESEVTMGIMLASGIGVIRDDAASLVWFRRAADQGNPYGLFNLAIMVRDGRGQPADRAEAIALMEAAERNGHPGAAAELRELRAQ